ncbi:MAG: hypothetical protein CMM05_05755 [Rhodopirellula sp.]|nr:hypothetical protein [Rhodopirellula sp.]
MLIFDLLSRRNEKWVFAMLITAGVISIVCIWLVARPYVDRTPQTRSNQACVEILLQSLVSF